MHNAEVTTTINQGCHNTKYGYIRVSTKGQAHDGNSMEAQESELLKEGVDASRIYREAFTGKTADRPEFKKLLAALQPDDTLIVTKLDRFARSMQDGVRIVNELIDNGVRVHILNIGVLDNSPANKLIRGIFFAFAEFERDMILERTQEGKAIARKKAGFHEGMPPKFTPEQIHHALELLETHSYRQVEEMTKISKSTLIRAKKKLIVL